MWLTMCMCDNWLKNNKVKVSVLKFFQLAVGVRILLIHVSLSKTLNLLNFTNSSVFKGYIKAMSYMKIKKTIFVIVQSSFISISCIYKVTKILRSGIFPFIQW